MRRCGARLRIQDSAYGASDGSIKAALSPPAVPPPRKGRFLRAPTLGRTLARTLSHNLAVTLAPLLTLAMVGIVPMSSAQAAVSSTAVYEHQAVKATNSHRTRRDLRALRTSACLSRYAERQADRMASQHRIFHQDLSPVLRGCGLRRVGENVASGYESGRSVVSDGWMKSAGHRRNILTRGFRIVAVGSARDEAGRWYTAQVLGRRR